MCVEGDIPLPFQFINADDLKQLGEEDDDDKADKKDKKDKKDKSKKGSAMLDELKDIVVLEVAADPMVDINTRNAGSISPNTGLTAVNPRSAWRGMSGPIAGSASAATLVDESAVEDILIHAGACRLMNDIVIHAACMLHSLGHADGRAHRRHTALDDVAEAQSESKA